MCGLTGFLSLKGGMLRSSLMATGRAMAQTLRHRGPDAGDCWLDEHMPLLLAHRRLSILDLSEAGHQPMFSQSGRYVIVYNGEIYNFPDLQRELEMQGTRFRGRSDTEILLAAIDSWGLSRTLQKINGFFAFALWDMQQKRLHLARDPLGKKPLYVGWAGESLVFGSELKALRAHPDFKPRLSMDTLALYFRYGYIPAPACVYEEVWSLPPGCRMDIEPQRLAPGMDVRPLMQPYWQAPAVAGEARLALRTDMNPDDAASEMEALLERCVKERMISDVPLGTWLSGGIDSTLVNALMQQSASKPVKSFSMGFDIQSHDEREHAAKIAQHLGTDHHEFCLTAAQAQEMIPSLPQIFDEPFADVSAIPTALLAQHTRAHVTVALTGDGGDEMMGGYRRHIQGPRLWRITRLAPRWMRIAGGDLLRSMPQAALQSLRPEQSDFPGGAYKAAFSLRARTPEELYRLMISKWQTSPLRDHGPARDFINTQIPEDFSVAERLMLWDCMHYLPGDILVKADRASMAFGLELRAPLLDKRVFGHVWSLPLSMKIRQGQGKWLLRRILARHVPPALFERPKQGFSMPVGDWLRGPLREWAEDLINGGDSQHNDFLDARAIRRCWNLHLQGRAGQEEKLWTILMWQAWQRHWL